MKDIQLSLTLEEVNILLSVMGDLPTKTGVFPLMMKVKVMAEAQIKETQNEPV
jgi:hypothetical protein